MPPNQLGATQNDREIEVSCALGANVLLFRRMQATEALSELSDYQVELLSERADIQVADVLATLLTVSVDLADGQQRHFNGFVTRFAYLGRQGRYVRYQATVRPWLWFLTRSSDCRMFQEKSVVDIVKSVFADYSIADFEFRHSGTYTARTYCVQYRETDFNFVSRIMEEEGLYYYFRSTAGRHVMVITDGDSGHDPVGGYERVRFDPTEDSAMRRREMIYEWFVTGEVQSGAVALNDFNFEKFGKSTSGGLKVRSAIGNPHPQGELELYDYPGRYDDSDAGGELAKVRIQSLHAQYERAVAGTQARGLFPGSLFTLSEHPRGDQNREYLVVSAGYTLVNAGYEAIPDATVEPVMDCRLSVLGAPHAYRADRRAPKPIVHGPQTAIVTGPAGEEIHTDKYGRIKVQFHWDREGKNDETSSVWIRVAQGWAGKGWGMMVLPRIGMEVVVTFLEGDPDRPLVTGCVYNADKMPPYTLPDDKTRSTIKSNSSKGGAGFNEIRFEDKKDAEEIFVHAEKDYNRIVMNDDTLKVGFEKKDKGDQTIAIYHDQSLDVGNDRKVHVKNNQSAAIDQDMSTKVGNDQSLEVGASQKIKVGTTCVIEANTSIELKVGASSIKIEPARITIKSVEIAIQADAMMAIKAGAVMTVEGALVKIN